MVARNSSLNNPRHAASRPCDAFSSDFHTLSHDLRTPLNHINGFAELLLLHGGLDPTQKSYVEAILRSSHALQKVVLTHLERADLDRLASGLPGPSPSPERRDQAASLRST